MVRFSLKLVGESNILSRTLSLKSIKDQDSSSSSHSLQVVPPHPIEIERVNTTTWTSPSVIRGELAQQATEENVETPTSLLEDLRAEYSRLESMIKNPRQKSQEIFEKWKQSQEHLSNVRKEGETLVSQSKSRLALKEANEMNDENPLEVAKMMVTNVWSLLYSSNLAKIQCLLLFICLGLTIAFSAYQFTVAYAAETAVFKPKKIAKQVTYFEGKVGVPQYEVPNVYILFLMHVSDWSKTPNETSQIEEFILSHMSMKESEAVAHYAATTSDSSEADSTESQSESDEGPSLKTVSNFSYFDEITEVEFTTSQTSFYPYCEAGTGKKIGVEHINVISYSTLQDTVNPTASPTLAPFHDAQTYSKRKKSDTVAKSDDIKKTDSVKKSKPTEPPFKDAEHTLTKSDDIKKTHNVKKSKPKEPPFKHAESIISGHKSQWHETVKSNGGGQRRSEDCCAGFCGGPGCEGRGGCYCDEYCVEQSDCCTDYETTCAAEISAGYWECNSGEAIPSSWVCDFYDDCDDGSDEYGCYYYYDYSYGYGGGWECANGEVIPLSWYCDYWDDCSDGSDEIGCDDYWWSYYYSMVDNVDCGNDLSKSSCGECAISADEADNCAGECYWLESDDDETGACVQGFVCTDGTTVTGCEDCGADNCEGDSCILDDAGSCTEAVCEATSIAWIGDGWCDDALGVYNTHGCSWDGGDCCEDTCSIGSTYECGSNGYNCLDPQSENYGAAMRVDEEEIPYDIAPFLLLLDMKFFPPSRNARKYRCHTSFTMYVPEDAGYIIETMFLVTRNTYTGLTKQEFMDLVDNELWATMPLCGNEAPLLEGLKMQVRYIEEYVDGKSKIITETDSSPQSNYEQHLIWEPFRTVTYYESYASYTYGQWFSSVGANYALATALFFLCLVFVPRDREDYGILAFMTMEYKNTNKVLALKHTLDDELNWCRLELQSLPGHKKK